MSDVDAQAERIDEIEEEKREAQRRDDYRDIFQPIGSKGVEGWLDDEATQIEPLVEHDGDTWMPRGKVGSLVAPGSTGKSQLLIQLAMCIASSNPNRRWLGELEVPERGNVVLALGEEGERDAHRRIRDTLYHWAQRDGRADISEDETASIHRRLWAMGMADKRTALMQEPTRLRYVDDVLEKEIQLRGGELEEDEIQARKMELLEGWTAQYRHFKSLLSNPPDIDHAPRWKAIILDPASQFIGPEVEKSSEAATRFVGLLKSWAKRTWGGQSTGPMVMTAHHASQHAAGEDRESFLSNPHASRGSTALTAGVRWQSNAYATPDCRASGHGSFEAVSVRVNKFNDAAGGSTLHLKRDRSIALDYISDCDSDLDWPNEEDSDE